ncbi:hypothetical protein SAMD00019534_002680 [Acytostelium subglobosum LB1]|uniref:hypothetical protein n=1 Tax=Acytostelium subglobosum LB1 TaxID=1410327 RepID=UPI000644FFEB|nr:hypothetical protein SAMD00019534_002680 [Acytostelium subglobosum LB1]GAM17093.1 hypothetical protein SAMD00019534_002680 [Acytostelium subglobosum LB1]|eukprot:XP_012759155.1 hypothetical protein SAMD00019534_002680 [Acytostelium subglobosum LB1]
MSSRGTLESWEDETFDTTLQPEKQQQEREQRKGLINLPSEHELNHEDAPTHQGYSLETIHPYFESKPTFKILARKKETTTTEVAPQKQPTKTLEEREKDYQRARALYLGSEDNTITTTSTTNTTGSSTTTTGSGSGNNSPIYNSPKNTTRDRSNVYSPGSLKKSAPAGKGVGVTQSSTEQQQSNNSGNSSGSNTSHRQPVGPDGSTRGFSGRGSRRHPNSSSSNN